MFGSARHHREVLERHLRRAVLADRHARVRSRQLDVQTLLMAAMRMKSAARVRKHAKVDGNGIAPRAGEPHRRADHHLLGDEVLVEALGRDLLELVAEGRVLHVGVERDDARVGFAELGERGAVRFAGRDLLAELVGGRAIGFGAAAARRGLDGGFGICGRGRRIAASTVARNCASSSAMRAIQLLALLERPAVPAVLAFDERHALALDRPRQNHRRPARGVPRASSSASRIADMSWPSTTIACQPNARQRRANCLHVVLPHRRRGSGRAR